MLQEVAADVRPVAVADAQPRAKVNFLPASLLAWFLWTVLAVVGTAGSGMLLLWSAERMNSWLLASLPGGPMMAWVQPCLFAGYIVYLTTVIFPFLLMLFWRRLGQQASDFISRDDWPFVSILIPAHNEQEIILDAIHGALNQRYPNFEVIVIDDGSVDLTSHLTSETPVRLIRLEKNMGKAAAMNRGIEAARGEIIVTCDADSYLDAGALLHVVPHFVDPKVGGVAGQVRLFHPQGWLRRCQVLEYDYNQGLIKQAQLATTGTVLVSPGPISAYRADVLRATGGVPVDTLTEDFDLTMQVVAHGMRVTYEPLAVAYTEAPLTDAVLRRQRIRWARGGFQVLRKFKPLIGESRTGLVGFFWLPYFFVTSFAGLPITLLLATALPLFVWGSNSPVRFLACMAVYAVFASVVEGLKVVIGVLLSDWRDLRFSPYIPLFLIYKKFRLDWFPLEALFREWRQAPGVWHG